MQSGVRSGVLLAVIGLWVILRSTHEDASHRTLINHLLGTGGSSTTPAAGAESSPAAAALSKRSIAAAENKSGVPYGITHPISTLTPKLPKNSYSLATKRAASNPLAGNPLAP